MSKIDQTAPASANTSNPASAGQSGTAGNVIALPAAPAEKRPSSKIIGFARKHPVLTVAGALAAGVLVSAVLPRRTGRRLLGKAIDLAEVTGAASVILGREAGDKAHDLGLGARKQASILADKAEQVSDVAVHALEKYGLAAVAAASALGRASAKRAARLGETALDTATQGAGKIGHAATDGSSKIVGLASEIRHRLTR